MIKDLTIAAMYDLVAVLKQHPNFLGMAEDERTQFPAISSMLKGISSESQLLEALNGLMSFVKNSGVKPENPLLKSLVNYFTLDFPVVFDQLDRAFYSSSRDAQMQRLNQLFPEKAQFFEVLRGRLLVLSPQDVTEAVIEFLQNVAGSPRVLAQSPLECAAELKKEIRSYFAKQYPKSIVQFSVNSQLIGGIRFFVDGKVEDHSWFARIQDIRKLGSLVKV